MTLLAAALGYAARGWPVLPLHHLEEGTCTCGKAGCTSPGKHPRLRHGVRDASTDAGQIRRWWKRWPEANVGIATGPVIAIDIDGRVGEAHIAALELEHGDLPPTLEAATGGGGRHLIYVHPGDGGPQIRNRNPWMPKVDVRGHGGYIVAPPSQHVSGSAYAWANTLEPAELGDHLALELIRGKPQIAPDAAPQPLKPLDPGDGDHLRRRLLKVVESRRNQLAAQTKGRYPALRAAAREFGGYAAHYGTAVLTEAEVADALLEAAEHNGALGEYGAKMRGAIQWGLEKGRESPMPLKDREGHTPRPPRPPPAWTQEPDLPPEPPLEEEPEPELDPQPQGGQAEPDVLIRLASLVQDAEIQDDVGQRRAVEELFDLVEELAAVWAEHEPQIVKLLTRARRLPKQAVPIDRLLKMIERAAQPQRRQARTDDALPEIWLGPDLEEVECQAIDALVDGDAALFMRGGRLAQVLRDGEGHVKIGLVDAYNLRTRLSRVANWMMRGSDGEPRRVPPPQGVSRGLISRGRWPEVRVIDGVTRAPVLRPDGTVLQTPGYDERTRVLYDPAQPFPPVPERPTLQDAQASCEALLELVADFPFLNGPARMGYVAAALTPLARHAFEGPAPWFLFTANVRGTGKSLLAAVAAVISTGQVPAAFAAPRSDEEMRKRITSIAIAGQQLVLIDNIPGAVGWPSFDAVLTSARHGDRVLGASEHVDLPMRTVWFGTVNNPTFKADTSRRVLPVPLDSPIATPERRTGFRRTNLLEHVLDHRRALTAHALTILRAYCVAGRPRQQLAPWGSYEGWSALVRGAIVWMGYPDPHDNVAELQDVDLEALSIRQLLEGLHGEFGTRAFLSKEVLARIGTDRDGVLSSLAEALDNLAGDAKLTSHRVGLVLRGIRNRPVELEAGIGRLRPRKVHRGSQMWQLEVERLQM